MTDSKKNDDAETKVSVMGRSYVLPKSRLTRMCIGVALVFGGILGFLPVLGFWMIPLGLLILSQDIPVVRRFRRRIWSKFNRWIGRWRNQAK